MDDTQPGKFRTTDYIVFAITLLVSASIGVYFRFTGGKQKTTQVMFIFGFYFSRVYFSVIYRRLWWWFNKSMFN